MSQLSPITLSPEPRLRHCFALLSQRRGVSVSKPARSVSIARSRVSAMATRNDRHDPSAFISLASAAKVSLNSTLRISAGYNRCWPYTLTIIPVMRYVMKRLTPPKSCISQAETGTGNSISRCNLRFAPHYTNTTGQGPPQRCENSFALAISHASLVGPFS